MARQKAIALRNGGDEMTLQMPAYAARYLKSMCERERMRLDNYAISGFSPEIVDAARDALNQIERALPGS